MSADTRGIRELVKELVFDNEVDAVTAFAESIVEQCCKDVCESCKNGLKAYLNEYGVWFHPEAPTSPFKCKADGIRSRWQRGEG